MTKSTRRRALAILWIVTALFLGTGVATTLVGAKRAAPSAAAATVGEAGRDVDSVGAGSQDASQAQGSADDVTGADATAAVPAPQGPTPEEGAPTGGPDAAGVAAEAAREGNPSASTPWYQRLVSVLGLFTMIFIAWLLSVDRRMVPWRIILWGLALQLGFGIFILRTGAGEWIFSQINGIIVALLGFTVQGARFLFGNLVESTVPVTAASGAAAPATGLVAETGAFFAFNVLPTIIFFSSLMTVLYHLGIMQAIVRAVAWVMMRTMRTSGAETLSTAGNIFVGQTEAPLLIKPFVATMTMSELMTVMTGGFATVAGGVMAAYVGMLVSHFPDIAGHLLAASVMSAPAALLISKVMYPEREEPETRGTLRITVESPDANVIDAAARGAGEGLTLALNVGAMLLAFIALIAVLNALLGWLGDVTHLARVLQGWGLLAADERLTFEAVLGWILAPLAWVMGVPWKDAIEVGALLGVKTVLNEFVAYLQLSSVLATGADLSPRSVVIATYALCGFANFSSIAIQIGGIGGIAPSRRSDLSTLGLRAMIGGSLAAFMTAAIAGILV